MLTASKYLFVKTKQQILISHLLECRSDTYKNLTQNVHFYKLNINEAYYY